MVFKKDLIELQKKKYKIHIIRKNIKNLKYVKTIKIVFSLFRYPV